jgi:ABC-type sugar transport system ATPase subunit
VSSPAVAPIRLVSIGKRYSGTKALDNVSVEVAGATVHALVGANGAGKTTLGKIVGGVIRPDEGQLYVDGRPVRYSSPREARVDGIVTITQELSPMPNLSVIENVFTGSTTSSFPAGASSSTETPRSAGCAPPTSRRSRSCGRSRATRE